MEAWMTTDQWSLTANHFFCDRCWCLLPRWLLKVAQWSNLMSNIPTYLIEEFELLTCNFIWLHCFALVNKSYYGGMDPYWIFLLLRVGIRLVNTMLLAWKIPLWFKFDQHVIKILAIITGDNFSAVLFMHVLNCKVSKFSDNTNDFI